MGEITYFKGFVVFILMSIVFLITNFKYNTYKRLEVIAHNQKTINYNQSIALLHIGMISDMRVMDSLQRINIDSLSKADLDKFKATIAATIVRAELRASKLDSVKIGLESISR